jgi:hypothetical protein
VTREAPCLGLFDQNLAFGPIGCYLMDWLTDFGKYDQTVNLRASKTLRTFTRELNKGLMPSSGNDYDSHPMMHSGDSSKD